MTEAAKYYTNAQEKITEHMLSLTRNLKEQTETANRIIRRDTELVSRSSGMAERNINSLSKEADKLEQHSKKAYKCWLWLMIVFVIVTFIGESWWRSAWNSPNICISQLARNSASHLLSKLNYFFIFVFKKSNPILILFAR